MMLWTTVYPSSPRSDAPIHRDIEVVERAGRHVVAMGIEARGHRGQITFEQFVVVGLVPALADAVVALVKFLDRLFHRHIVGRLFEQVELDPLAPPLRGFFRSLRIRGSVLVADHRFVHGKIVLLIQVGERRIDTLVNSLQEPAEHVVGELDVAVLECGGQLVLLGLKLVDVALIEK
jgi:hypothetical protein